MVLYMLLTAEWVLFDSVKFFQFTMNSGRILAVGGARPFVESYHMTTLTGLYPGIFE